MKWILIPELQILLLLTGIICLSLVFFPKKRMEIALLLFSSVFAILTAEAVLRIGFPQIMEHDVMFQYEGNLGWTFIPNHKGGVIYPGEASHYIETNSRGFRDSEPGSQGSAVNTLLVLGDSFVSNISVRDDEVFTELIEKQLDNTDVLNFGVNGYGQVQEFLLLKKWYEQTDPDLVILMIYIRNDFQDNTGGYWLYPRPVAAWNEEQSTLVIDPPAAARTRSASGSSWRVSRHSHLYVGVERALRSLSLRLSNADPERHRASRHTPPELYLCLAQPSEETQLMFQIMKELLLRIASYVDDKGGKIVFALAPSIVQVEDDLWSSMLKSHGVEERNHIKSLPNDKLMEFAENKELLMLDLLPVLRAETKDGGPLYNPNEQHWNSAGNRVVANTLLSYLRNEALID